MLVAVARGLVRDEDRVRGHRSPRGQELARSVRLAEEDAVMTTHEDHRAGHFVVGDGLRDRRVDLQSRAGGETFERRVETR